MFIPIKSCYLCREYFSSLTPSINRVSDEGQKRFLRAWRFLRSVFLQAVKSIFHSCTYGRNLSLKDSKAINIMVYVWKKKIELPYISRIFPQLYRNPNKRLNLHNILTLSIILSILTESKNPAALPWAWRAQSIHVLVSSVDVICRWLHWL